MRIGISIKWTFSAVVIVILVVAVYAFFTNSDMQKSVDQETERIRRIQYEALDQLGAQTAKTLSLPASSLMFDNDLGGLNGLLAPIVDKNADNGQSYSPVYATIIAPEGRVWVTRVTPNLRKLSLAGMAFFDREASEGLAVEALPDIAAYDVVFVGAPVWWYTMAPPLFSILEQIDFQGKKVVPFSTQGSNTGTFFEDFAATAKNAQILQHASFNNMDKKYDKQVEAKVTDWINKL